MRIAQVINQSYTDGPGSRTVLFVQGCDRHCTGCQNVHLWPFTSGYTVKMSALVADLLSTRLPVTISGGEPFAQAKAVAELIARLKIAGRHVIVYTGYTIETLLADSCTDSMDILQTADVLVDGSYISQLDHDYLQYRGSSNQRPIDLHASRAAGWQKIVTLNWDTPEILLTPDGDILGAAGVMHSFFSGNLEAVRRCGQTRM